MKIPDSDQKQAERPSFGLTLKWCNQIANVIREGVPMVCRSLSARHVDRSLFSET